jgi:adenine C2-methylase RlmN of 23S rRNA A2503 and tRNA A37
MTEVSSLGKDIRIALRRQDTDTFVKVSYPQQFGVYSEIETAEAGLRFNLNDEIVYLRGKGRDWPHPQEWLKRTVGNDWIYYSTGGYTGVFEAIGEYYLPNTPYPTNSLLGGQPFLLPAVSGMINSWYPLLQDLAGRVSETPTDIREFFSRALASDPATLQKKAEAFFAVTGGRVTVLPPDARHVDYNVIPIHITEGCLYKCRFCRVKTDRPFREKSNEEIDCQIEGLRKIYGKDLANYNSVFLGEHDALAARPGLIVETIEKASTAFGFSTSRMKGGNVFLFGSVDSLLEASRQFFADLARLPVNVYLNIGLESADQETLDRLGKPVRAAQVIEAFARMQEINTSFASIEMTANFVMDEDLPASHYSASLQLLRNGIAHSKPKGSVYFSPLKFDRPSRSQVMAFHRIKILSRLPTFLYIIQRL